MIRLSGLFTAIEHQSVSSAAMCNVGCTIYNAAAMFDFSARGHSTGGRCASTSENLKISAQS